MSTPPHFTLFFVCTGNQARSPLAAAWTARALSDLPVRVGSTGTLARRAGPVLHETHALASELGLDLRGHSSSSVAEHDLSRVDLVIGFEAHHVAAAVVDGGAHPGRTFLLKELVRLIGEVDPPHDPDPVARARSYVALADERRRGREHVRGQEIDDPAGRRPRVFRQIMTDVIRTCDELLRILFKVPRAGAPAQARADV